jgi:Fe2+ transport system protein FeoA
MPGHPPSAPRTLADVPVGSRVWLEGADLAPVRVRRLAELGLRAGAEVTVLLRTAGRGRIIALAQDRIALDRGTLRGLRVSESRPGRPEAGAQQPPTVDRP